MVTIIGGGLAGSEAAWQAASLGVPVTLHEMRPLGATPVHKTDRCAELVCSNSFRSDDAEHNAVGLLHEEMRRLGSLIMRAADCGQPMLAKEAAGLHALSKGLSLNFADDHEMLRHGMVTYDALYAWCAHSTTGPLKKVARLLGLK